MSDFNISWLNALPPIANLKKTSIYVIKPSAGVKPSVYVTNNTATEVMLINPDVDVSAFLKSVNNIQGTNGNVNIDVNFNGTTGVLTLTGGTNSINLDARYLKLSEYIIWKNETNGRLDNLELAMIDGMRAPKPFDASTATVFPTAKKGDTYKVTKAGTVEGVALEVGDTLIYDADGKTPYVLQTNIDQATFTVRGTIRLATQVEVNAGTDAQSAVVPSTLASRLTSFKTEITATQAEVTAGTVTNKFISPATLKPVIDPIKTDIANLKADQHTHTNKPVLDKFTETNGSLNYAGSGVFTLGASEW